jgi:hypothetical protein
MVILEHLANNGIVQLLDIILIYMYTCEYHITILHHSTTCTCMIVIIAGLNTTMIDVRPSVHVHVTLVHVQGMNTVRG